MLFLKNAQWKEYGGGVQVKGMRSTFHFSFAADEIFPKLYTTDQKFGTTLIFSSKL